MKIDKDCLYTKSHEWIRLEGDEGVAGITDYAQEQLSDIVFVELPEPGDAYDQGEMYATVESVKAASDCYLPLGGEVIEINADLENEPQLVNSDPYGGGWFVRIRLSDPGQAKDLLTPAAYEKFCAEAE
ncbi:MAG: glycine cleavage system protein GcvH [Chloroflexi bacterium]|nr:glycine cleavage system protein GcvH [Chloroflexota bacterium]MBU1751154.1 glycine cleavage system protein GcvH [Chloroflexota bacterium]